MIVTEVVHVENTITTDVNCDRCGQSCCDRARYGTNPESYVFEYATIKWNFGFFSSRDGDSGEAQVCQACFEELEKWLTARKARITAEPPTD